MEEKKINGGLYSKVKMSVKTADIIILIGMAALIFCVIFGVKNAQSQIVSQDASPEQIKIEYTTVPFPAS